MQDFIPSCPPTPTLNVSLLIWKFCHLFQILLTTLVINTWLQMWYTTCMTADMIHYMHDCRCDTLHAWLQIWYKCTLHAFMFSFVIQHNVLIFSQLHVHVLVAWIGWFCKYNVYSSQECWFWKACVLGTGDSKLTIICLWVWDPEQQVFQR